MGGSSYDRDVGSSSSSGGFYSGGTSSTLAKSALSRSSLDPSLNPFKRTVKSEKESPIVIALDVTGSNTEFARIVYDKAPMLHGQIEQQGYLKDFDICFSAVGDAYSDSAPLQICDFDFGIGLDDKLKKIFLEGRGGGTMCESYELAAHYFVNNCEMPNAKLPFFFFIGDEAPYARADKSQLEKLIGNVPNNRLDSTEIFSDLFKQFNGNVFFLQNAYYGNRADVSSTNGIRAKWLEYFGTENGEKIIQIHDEKSVIDVILGTIALVTRSRTMDTYTKDLAKRGQTNDRIGTVEQSLGGLSKAIVPYVKAGLTTTSSSKKNKSGGRKL